MVQNIPIGLIELREYESGYDVGVSYLAPRL